MLHRVPIESPLAAICHALRLHLHLHKFSWKSAANERRVIKL